MEAEVRLAVNENKTKKRSRVGSVDRVSVNRPDRIKLGSLTKLSRDARFIVVQRYQNGKNIPKDHKIYQTYINERKWP
jgi:hypothetical protein